MQWFIGKENDHSFLAKASSEASYIPSITLALAGSPLPSSTRKVHCSVAPGWV